MTKKNIMPVAVLAVICVIVAILLAVVNHFAAPEIAKNLEKKINESRYAVLSEAEGFEEVKLDGFENKPKSVLSVHKDKGGKGYVIVLETSTSYTKGDKMNITVGVGSDGAVKGVTVNAYSESRDFGRDTYPKTFIGLTTEDINTSDDNLLVAEVTYSSKAFKAAVKQAIDFAGVIGGAEEPDPIPEDLPKTDEEIITLASALIGEGADLEDVTPKERDLVKRVYKDKGGKGYVAYVIAISPDYGTVETETLIHIKNTGRIAGVNKLLWKTSDAIYGYVPPTAEAVDAFYAKFIGKNSTEFKTAFTGEGVELVSNATKTSGRLVESFVEAFGVIDALITEDIPREENEVNSLAAALVGEGADLERVDIGANEHTRRLYRDKGGKGFVAYLIAISPDYGTVETETLVHVGNDGNIVGVNKLLWKTSDAIYGYVPPTAEAVDAFYAKFIGKNSTEFKREFTGEGVELVSNATKTSGRLVESFAEAFEIIDSMLPEADPAPVDTTPRTVGIVILAVSLASVSAIVVFNIVRRRRVK